MIQDKKISNKKTLAKFISIKNAINLIKPKYYLPSAGPAIFPFLDPDLSFGVDNIFVHQPKIKKATQRQLFLFKVLLINH